MTRTTFWITAHRDIADRVFGEPAYSKICDIKSRLERLGYDLKLDVGKRSTRATVKKAGFCAKSTYGNLANFLMFEDLRLSEMEAAHDR